MLSVCHTGCQELATGVQACQGLKSSVWIKNEEKDRYACAVGQVAAKEQCSVTQGLRGQTTGAHLVSLLLCAEGAAGSCAV